MEGIEMGETLVTVPNHQLTYSSIVVASFAKAHDVVIV